ncbi:MAG TPA: phosphoribosylanthranilate isomerase [Vicinamibacterales bacterium]
MMVKICGIRRQQDAEAAIDHGASAIGFIFWPSSPRFIDPYRARQIAKALPPFVSTVGVFVNQPREYINGVASLVPLSVVQLHGDETPDFASHLSRPVLKAVTKRESVREWPKPAMLLVDVHDPVKRGGTGRVVDWSMAAAIARERHIVLAGGLTPDNVAEAVAAVQPWGIDVSSGVEESPGIKDERRIAALFAAIHQLRVPTL